MEETKKKGTAGRKPSGEEYTTVIMTKKTRFRLRKFADSLEEQTGQKFSMHKTIDWLLDENSMPRYRKIKIVTETPDGE